MAKIDTTQTLAPPLAAWGRLAANSTAHMVEHLFNGVIAVILPLITTALGLSLAQAATALSIIGLGGFGGNLMAGWLVDRVSATRLATRSIIFTEG